MESAGHRLRLRPDRVTAAEPAPPTRADPGVGLAPVMGQDIEIVHSHGPALRASQALTASFGSPWAVVAITIATIGWLIAGRLADYSRAWELVATVGLPIIALLALFVVQHTQNHNGRALQLKLDELLRAMADADDRLVAVEDVDEHRLHELRATYRNDLDDSVDSGESRVIPETNPVPPSHGPA